MADIESLGSERRTPLKFVFLLLVILATVYVAYIFLNKFSEITPDQLNQIFKIMLPSIIAIGMLGLSGWTLAKGNRNKIFIAVFLIALAGSVFFIRQLVTIFSSLALPQGIGLSLVYTVMGIVSSIVIGINSVSPKIKPPIDTVTIEPEEEAVFKFSQRTRFLIALGIAIVTALVISSTKQAFVKAPIFGLSDALYSEAVTSAIVGGILETAFFFSILQPVIHSVAFKFLNNGVLASLIGIVGITVLFFLFHTTVYKYDTQALKTVAIFGFLNSLVVFTLRDNLINISWHGANNFFAVLLRLVVFGVV